MKHLLNIGSKQVLSCNRKRRTDLGMRLAALSIKSQFSKCHFTTDKRETDHLHKVSPLSYYALCVDFSMG